MLGILLLYFIGKRFYELAGTFGKNKWLYAILSIVVYYSAAALLIVVVMFLDLIIFQWDIDWEATWGWGYISIPFGLLGVWVFYILLKRYWEKPIVLIKDEIQEIGTSEIDS